MDWDQIESKWAAMTRRVCGGMPATTTDAISKPKRQMTKGDANASTDGLDRTVSLPGNKQTAMLAQ
jgi:hypothetical protein